MAEMASRLEVSRRTIARDVEALSAAGVPVFTERGRGGGVRLLEGYFLPALMFSRGEAVAILLGLTVLRGLNGVPYAEEIEAAWTKLVAAIPDQLRTTLSRMEQVLGVEQAANDMLHEEDVQPQSPDLTVSGVVTIFLQALLDRRAVRLRYRSPYRAHMFEGLTQPLGMFLDRDRWYLVGQKEGATSQRIWRADRVLAIAPDRPSPADLGRFDVRCLLGRAWLREAMEEWRQRAPVLLQLTHEQANGLRRDWYYSHAHFEEMESGGVMMSFGEDDPARVLSLLRWLGPGAELVRPAEWREQMARELRDMLAGYSGGRQHES